MILLAAAVVSHSTPSPPRQVRYDYDFVCKAYSVDGKSATLSGRLAFRNDLVGTLTMRVVGAGYPVADAERAMMNGVAEAYVTVRSGEASYLYNFHFSEERRPANGYVTISRATLQRPAFSYVATGTCDVIPQEAAAR